MTDDVQPQEGQGAGGTDSGLYDLDSVSPEVRELLEPHLKAVEGNVTKKFQDAAEYRKSWEPYEQMGLNQMDPETVGELLGFYQLAQDPQQFDQWLQATAQERGLFGEGQGDLQGLDVDDMSTDSIQELVAKEIAAKVDPIQEQLQAQQQERQVQEANESISQQLEQIKAENPDLPDDAQDAIVRLAYSYSDEDQDPIQKGFEVYKSLIGQGEKSLFEQKSGQPQTPEGPGAPDSSAEKIVSFSDPRLKAAALEKMRHSQ